MRDNRTQVAFKNCAPFINCITKIDGITISDVKDLDLVMSMYNLLEYSSNHSYTTGNLCFYSKDQATNSNADIKDNDYFKFFVHITKLVGETEAQPTRNINNGILKFWKSGALPLKYLGNFLEIT